MATALWKRGRRLLSTAATLMLLTAVAHTIGNLAARPEGEEIRVFAAMSDLHVAMGSGMNPSIYDIYRCLAFTMSITLAALGLMNLLLTASAEVSDRVLRRVTWVNAVWVGAFLILSWFYQIPPPLISAALIEAALIAALVAGRGKESVNR